MSQQKQQVAIKIKYRWIKKAFLYVTLLLLLLLAGTPGVLRLIHRADAQVALGHAKSVRMAIQVTGTEQYGKGEKFCDASQKGGIPESLYNKILSLSDAPGEFWVIQVSNDGYEIQQFIYREGDYTVWYQANPRSYQVYREEQLIDATKVQDKTGDR